MAEFNGTPHNTAKVGDIAKTVIMPGDPLRAKFIAETFLENPKQFNAVRGMNGYTGTYKGKEVSVMAHGMGIPSIGIYSYELYAFYGVENIIRIGSAGSPLPVMSVVVADRSYSSSSFAKVAYGYEENYMLPDAGLNEVIIKAAEAAGKKVHVGPISSGDVFYTNPNLPAEPFADEVIALEMESFGLFANARYLGKKAACIVTISDSFGAGEEVAISAEERQTAMRDMMVIALDAAVSL